MDFHLDLCHIAKQGLLQIFLNFSSTMHNRTDFSSVLEVNVKLALPLKISH